MYVPACFILMLSLIAVSDLHAYANERSSVAVLIAKLSSKDAATRREAADKIIEQRYHVRVARHGSSLSDASWQTFADAVMKKKHWISISCLRFRFGRPCRTP